MKKHAAGCGVHFYLIFKRRGRELCGVKEPLEAFDLPTMEFDCFLDSEEVFKISEMFLHWVGHGGRNNAGEGFCLLICVVVEVGGLRRQSGVKGIHGNELF